MGEVGGKCDSWEDRNLERGSCILRICVRIGMMENVPAYKVGPRGVVIPEEGGHGDH